MTRVGVVGLWHLGCVLAASWSRLGNEVIAVDFDPRQIGLLERAVPPLFEPGLEQALRQGLTSGLLRFSGDASFLSSCRFVFIAHDTPVEEDDAPNLTSVEADFVRVLPHLADLAVVVVSAQLPVGTARRWRRMLREAKPGAELVYSPENLRLGEALACYANPGHIVLGGDDPAAIDAVAEFFSPMKARAVRMNLTSAEMAKHAINSFLAVSIGLANELADQCEASGASFDAVSAVMRLDPRIGPRAYLSAGIGFSGGTLGRDLSVLETAAVDAGREPRLVRAVRANNSDRVRYVGDRISAELGDLDGRVIALFGMTYKAGTSTLRRSLPLAVARDLIDRGASVRVYDPKADWEELPAPVRAVLFVASSPYSAAEGAHVALLMTEWPEFLELDLQRLRSTMAEPVFFDTKSQLRDRFDALQALGFRVMAIGRGDITRQ